MSVTYWDLHQVNEGARECVGVVGIVVGLVCCREVSCGEEWWFGRADKGKTTKTRCCGNLTQPGLAERDTTAWLRAANVGLGNLASKNTGRERDVDPNFHLELADLRSVSSSS